MGDPGVDEGLEGRVEGDVAVGVEFPDRGAKPVAGADLDDGVDAQAVSTTVELGTVSGG